MLPYDRKFSKKFGSNITVSAILTFGDTRSMLNPSLQQKNPPFGLGLHTAPYQNWSWRVMRGLHSLTPQQPRQTIHACGWPAAKYMSRRHAGKVQVEVRWFNFAGQKEKPPAGRRGTRQDVRLAGLPAHRESAGEINAASRHGDQCELRRFHRRSALARAMLRCR